MPDATPTSIDPPSPARRNRRWFAAQLVITAIVVWFVGRAARRAVARRFAAQPLESHPNWTIIVASGAVVLATYARADRDVAAHPRRVEAVHSASGRRRADLVRLQPRALRARTASGRSARWRRMARARGVSRRRRGGVLGAEHHREHRDGVPRRAHRRMALVRSPLAAANGARRRAARRRRGAASCCCRPLLPIMLERGAPRHRTRSRHRAASASRGLCLARREHRRVADVRRGVPACSFAA